MRSLRHNRMWPLWMVVLTMVFTIGGRPALANACGQVSDAPQQNQAAPSESCETMGMQGPCCCQHATVAEQSHHAAGAESSEPGCGCAVRPSNAPVSDSQQTKAAATSVFALVLAALDFAGLELEGVAPIIEPEISPPNEVERSSGPSRAPPSQLPISG